MWFKFEKDFRHYAGPQHVIRYTKGAVVNIPQAAAEAALEAGVGHVTDSSGEAKKEVGDGKKTGNRKADGAGEVSADEVGKSGPAE